MKDVPAPPADEWAAIIGDAAHNYMAALDHLVCRLAIANGADPDCRTTEFPIFDDPTRFDDDAMRKIRLLAGPDQAAVRELQPFAVPGAPRAHPLWLLRELDTIDKHRRLHVIAVQGDQWIDSQRAQGIDITDVRRLGGTKVGEEILRFRIVGSGGSTGGAIALGVTIDARFGPGSGDLTGIQVAGLLDAIHRHVRERVFPAFAAAVGPLPVDGPPSSHD